MKTFLVSLTLAILSATSGASGAAPPQLLGKSVIVTWGENRMQRDEGQPNFRAVSARHQMSVYIS
jgi:hypothetical protein